ncbi:MAG: DUF1361 domain-containing protein [Anaerolineales bacterium]|nr:DUF1361 domain-containing protein [Anaerolineales bacterium]
MLILFKQFHRLALSQGLYPVVLSTLFAFTLLAGRVYLSRQWTYLFLVWNLFLAWIPYLTSLWTSPVYPRQSRRWGYLLLPGLLWLAFFPNAPYIVTDFLHLQHRPPVPVWYDMGLISIFAWTGLFLAVFSLRAMQMLVKTAAGPVLSWLFVVSVMGLSGLGIYIGRFLGWNSWDLFIHPEAVLTDILIRFTNPFQHTATFGVSLMFALFLLVCYLTVTADSLHRQS